MCKMKEEFGKRLRQRRKEKGVGLREAAGKVSISPTFLSRIETGSDSALPSEQVIAALAKLLDDDFDHLMRLAGRVPSEVAELIKADPQMPAFLRHAKAKKLTGEDLFRLLDRKNGDDDRG